jgi:hypothetical protein
MTMFSSGESPIEETKGEWTDVLEIPGTSIVGWMTVINEGDWPGWFRLVDAQGEGAVCRLPCGGGESGERRASLAIPCPGFSGGRLQVRKGLLGGDLTGVYAFAGK